jgi:excisionase family DNA binding protein
MNPTESFESRPAPTNVICPLLIGNAPVAGEAFLMTPRQTAQRLAISERHLFALTHSGQLPCVRVGKCVRYSVETIRNWVRSLESAGQSPPAQTDAEERPRPPTPPASSHRRKEDRQRLRTQSREPVNRTPKTRPRASRASSHGADEKERITPLTKLLESLGINRANLPVITNGELMRIAEVDSSTLHGWTYRNMPLPEEAMNRLRDHFRRLITEAIEGR